MLFKGHLTVFDTPRDTYQVFLDHLGAAAATSITVTSTTFWEIWEKAYHAEGPIDDGLAAINAKALRLYGDDEITLYPTLGE